MSESNGKRPRIKLSSLFITYPDSLSFSDNSKSLKSPFDNRKSPRNFEGEVVGLGIVAAMNENGDTQEAFSGAISTRTAKSVVSPRSAPIPIVSGNPVTKTETPMSELSESYTCVKMNGMDGNYEGKSGGFHLSQPKQLYVAEPVNDFLNTCYLCRKDLHGLDIFMYRWKKRRTEEEVERRERKAEKRIMLLGKISGLSFIFPLICEQMETTKDSVEEIKPFVAQSVGASKFKVMNSEKIVHLKH